jgi:HEAT repeat protein
MDHRNCAFGLLFLALVLLCTKSPADDDVIAERDSVESGGPSFEDLFPRAIQLGDLDRLIDLLDSPSEGDRYQAAFAIGALGPPAIQASAALIEHLNDSEIRSAAARALLSIGADYSPVLALLDDEEIAVRLEVSKELIARRIELEKVIPYVLQLGATADGGFEYPNLEPFSAFGPSGINTATPILIRSLLDENPKVAEKAYFVLSELFYLPGSAAVPLAKLTTDAKPSVRLHATKLLNRLGESALPALPSLRRLLNDSDDAIRVEAAALVAKLDANDLYSMAVLNEIAGKMLADSEVLQSAFSHLGEFGERSLQSVPAIVQGLNATDKWVSHCACEALTRIGPKTIPALVEVLRQRAGDPGFQRLRIAGLRVLADFGTEATSAHDLMLAATGSQAVEEQLAGVHALGAVGRRDGETIKRLLALLDSQETQLRSAAVKAIGKLVDATDPATILRLSRMLQDPDSSVCLAACESLSHISPGSAGVSNTLIKLLSEGEPQTVVDACDLIATIKSATAPTAAVLAGKLASDKFVAAGFSGHPVRQSARYALAAIGKPSVPELIKALAHNEPQVRGLAAEALGSIGKDACEAIPKLMELLNDNATWTSHCGCMGFSTEVRQAAVRALGEIGPDATIALPQIIALMCDDVIGEAAIKAVGGIGAPAIHVIPELLGIDTDHDYRADLNILIAVHSIDPEFPLVDRLRLVLQAIEIESAEYCNWSAISDAMDLVIKMGRRSNALKPTLENMIFRNELLDQDCRGEAAYAMGMIEPRNPVWRETVAKLVARDPNSLLRDRLAQLDARKQ